MGKINNIDMLNSIREQQNLEYQSLIPKVSSQDDCLQVLATFESYPTTKNAFINTLTNRIGKSLFFDKVLELGTNPKTAINFIMGEIAAYLKENKVEITETKLTPENLADLISLIEKGTITRVIKDE